MVNLQDAYDEATKVATPCLDYLASQAPAYVPLKFNLAARSSVGGGARVGAMFLLTLAGGLSGAAIASRPGAAVGGLLGLLGGMYLLSR